MQVNWVPSPNFNRLANRKIKAIVIHTAECAELPKADDNVAAWFKNPASKVSAHYVVDCDSITQCVLDEHVAWHAGRCNDWTIGIELCGRAAQTEAQWDDDYSRAELDLAAALVAELCEKHAIPIVRLTPEQAKRGDAGIFGHVDVSGPGGHWDPGQGFPWDAFLARVITASCPPPGAA